MNNLRQCHPIRQNANPDNYCGKWDDIANFPNGKYQCSDCVKRCQKKYREDPIKKSIAETYHKQWYEKNKITQQNNAKSYYQQNKEKKKEYQKNRYLENKEYELAYQKKYRNKNKNILRIKSNKRQNQRRKNDPIFALRKNVSSTICVALKNNHSNKNGASILKYLGENYIIELKKHIEKQFSNLINLDNNAKIWMTWDNWGKYNAKTWDDNDPSTWTWQLDHIIPHSDFHYETMDCQEFRDCWAFSNLRPLPSKQNWFDGVNRKRHRKTYEIC